MKKNALDQMIQSATSNPNNNIINNTLSAQRERLLEALKSGPVTTNEARDNLNIMSPAPRIMELRRSGHNIIKEMIWQFDIQGRKHKAAKYYWIKSVAKGGDV